MSRPKKRRPAAAMTARKGLAPGSPIYTGEPREGQVIVRVIHYSPDGAREAAQVAPDALAAIIEEPGLTWIDVEGVHQAEVVQAVCELLGIHPLAMEDVLNPTTRPKVDDYGDHVLVAARMIRVTDALPEGSDGEPPPPEARQGPGLDIESVALVLGPRWVVTFQERPGDLWDGVRERIRHGRGRIRRMGADYLLHALLDGIVDGVFEAVHAWEIMVEALEDEALGEEADAAFPRRVHHARARLNAIRRLLQPVREGILRMTRGDLRSIGSEARPYYNDLQDHLAHALDLLDAARDRLIGALELHLALASHRMNEIMRVLTVVATIFMPITFVAGIYGMNFARMPELHQPWGYPMALGIMLSMAVGMLGWFRRKGWL